MAHTARKKSKFKGHHAIILLLFITVGAALAAFFWLGAVEKHIEYKDIVIESVKYDASTGDIDIALINGLNTDVAVKSSGKPSERTVITIYPIDSDEDVDCDFVPLGELSCENDGACDCKIKPKEKATLSLGGDRVRCLLPADLKNYYLNIFFGMRAPVGKEFSIK